MKAKMIHGALVLLLVVLLVPAILPAEPVLAQTVIFSDDFEYDDSLENHGWTIEESNSQGDPQTAADPENPGNRVAYIQSIGDVIPFFYHSFSELPLQPDMELSIRFYDTGDSCNNCDVHTRVWFNNGSDYIRVGWYNSPSSFCYAYQVSGIFGGELHEPYGLRGIGWHTFTWRVEASGGIDLLIDGNLIIDDLIGFTTLSKFSVEAGSDPDTYSFAVDDFLASGPTAANEAIVVDGNPDDWSSFEPAIVDPQGDSICGADADIKRVYTAMDDSYAYVMVETYGVPINEDAVIEINFDYKPGQHIIHGSACCDDLTTNIWSNCNLGAWNDDDLDGVMQTYPIAGFVCARGDVMELAIPLSEIENAEYFNATFVNIFDYSYEMGNWGCDGSESGPTSIETITGTGSAGFVPSAGSVEDLTAVATPSGAPVEFPHGMFTFKITGVSFGEEITLTVELPDPVPVGTKWWKYHNNTWSPMDIGDDDGDNVITVALKDGRIPDDEDTTAGQITDQGGPGSPGSVGWETYSINKARVLLPWIVLFAAVVAAAGLLVLRRRRARS